MFIFKIMVTLLMSSFSFSQCCLASLTLSCLHKDSVLIPRLDGEKQVTPTIMAAAGVLLTASVLRSRFWAFYLYLPTIGGFFEARN